MSKRLIAAALLGSSLAAWPATAQNGPDNDANGAPGFTKSVFDSGQIDSINIYNGQLTVPIPVGPSYPLGPKLRMQLLLNYNSRVDDYGRPGTQQPDFYYKPLVGNPALGIGWEMTLGAIKPCKHGIISGNCYFAPDGSQHMFTLASKTGDGSQLFLKGTGPYDMWDGDGNHYVFGNAGHVTGFDDSTTNYTHDFGIGRNGWYLTSVSDPFGNSYSVTYYSSIATPLWTYSSNGCSTAWGMLNPSVTNTWIVKDITLPSGTVHVATAQVNGINGMIKSVDFPELVDGASVTKTWTLVYETAAQSYSRPCESSNTIVANLQRLKQLQLPADLTGSPSYQFTYSGLAFGKGLLDRITLPTTGSLDYCYGGYVFYHASAGSIEPGCPGLFPDSSDAVVTQSSACGLAAPEPLEPSIPGRCTPDNSARWIQTQTGVVRRRETLGSVKNDTHYVAYAFPFGESGNAADPQPAQNLSVVISPPTDTATSTMPDAGRRRARALLLDTATEDKVLKGPADNTFTGDRVGQDIEERVFETDPTTGTISDPPCGGTTESNFCGSKAVRVTQKTYEYDTTGIIGANRRLNQHKTIHGASTCGTCPYHQVDFTLTGGDTWDGNGQHFNTETHTGSLGGDARTIATDWAPVNWSSNPSNLTALPNVLNQRTTTQGSSVRDEYFDFDTTPTAPTGFLKGTFVYDSVKDIAFINCSYEDGDGNADKEFTKTLSSASVPARTYCSDNHPTFPTSVGTDGDIFGKDYTWQKGELLNARWINGAVGTTTFKFADNTRDSTTGWITSSRDTAGRQTSYTYDSLGRVNQITPPATGELKTWVCYESPNATTAYRAAAKQTCPVASSNAAIATWQHFNYDALGRLVREKRLQPSSSIVKRFTLFNGPGHAYFTSEWVTDATSEAITTDKATACVFSGGKFVGRARPSAAPGTYSMCWDPFGRPQQIIGPKHSSLVTVDRTDGTGNIYSDTKDSITTWCVNATFADLAAATCNAGAIVPNPVTATKRDAFGRITSATEPTLETTSYAYDVNGKLTAVTQGAQSRSFGYDTNGFMRSESTPERGSVVYNTIGSLGNVRQKTEHGSLIISRTFDFAGRLTREDVPSGTKYVVNCYDGAATCVDGSTGFAGGSYPGGKLTRRYGYNWIPLIGPIVDEQFTYSDGGGRLSQLGTTVGNGDLSSRTTQTWTYDATNCHLGLVCSNGHPRVTGSFPVNYTYTNGLPTAISANATNVVTAATYNPAAGFASWTAGNTGTPVITTITQDTSLLPRPSQIQAKRGSTVLFNTGTYSYDSAGNILGQSDATYGGTYTYDNRSRILSATYGASSKSFSYDRWGNLLSNSPLTFQMSTSNNNHIKVGGSTTGVSYDARGNLTTYNTETMFYDSRDRLYRNKNASGDYTFLHNGAGERVVKFPTKFTVLRREMARYIAEANIIARGWTLPLCDGSNPSPFTDVSCSDPDAKYIKLVAQQGITAGCGGGLYCPNTAITRAQMAVFMVKGYRGAAYVPTACPPAVNPFTDFTCSGPYAAFAPFIIQLYNDGVTAGCGAGTFCPGNSIGEWETLVWLAKGGTPGAPFWPTYHPVPRGSIYTLRDEQNRVATEIAGGLTGSSTATLSVARDNVFLGSLLVASNATGTWQYNASDHLGSPRAVWNSSGTKFEDHKYWPYGEDTSAILNQHLAFTLMERNDALPVYYDHARSQQFNLGRFLSPDKLKGSPASPQSWNRYTYAASNPMRLLDRNGRWPSSPLKPVHQNSIDRVLGKLNLTYRQLSILKSQQIVADRGANQTRDNQFKHGMSGAGQSKEKAQSEANAFVRSELAAARKAAMEGNLDESMVRLGNVIHLFQDATSPEHYGFQEWAAGFLSTLSHAGHVLGELFDPGLGSNLDAATLLAYQYYTGARTYDGSTDFFGDLHPDERGGPFQGTGFCSADNQCH
ncbi:MAG: RHS repeat-associated core domain-containing protein [Thermoanaerobaculia bacterium]